MSDFGGAVGEFHPTLGSRWPSGGGLLEHGRKEGVYGSASSLAHGLGPDRNLWTLTLVENLTVGIVAGCLLAAVFAIYNRAIPD
jgi:hypothetical protein